MANDGMITFPPRPMVSLMRPASRSPEALIAAQPEVRSVEGLAVQGRWQALARGNLRDEFYRIRRDLTAQLLRKDASAAVASFERWLEANAAGIRKFDGILEEMRRRQEVDFATLSVAAQELRKLISN